MFQSQVSGRAVAVTRILRSSGQGPGEGDNGKVRGVQGVKGVSCHCFFLGKDF